MKFILKFFPEITIKSGPVRKRMSRQLTENLRILLRRFDPEAKVNQEWDNLEVFVPGEDEERARAVADLLARVPGIGKFARVRAYPLASQEEIYEHVLRAWESALAGKTFCVRVKRTGKHDFTSTDLERYLGGRLLHETGAAGVDLHNPDHVVRLEIRHDTVYIVEHTFPGLGGFPLGSQEAVLSLVSGGFDSTVACYQSIKRGLRTHFLFFNLGGLAHELGVKEIAFYLWNRFGSSHRVKFVTVPFDGVVNEILTKVDPSCMGVILKRFMLRAASQVADGAGLDALVTGEAVAQVSSQTLTNLAIIDRASTKLVLRPLAFMDKGQIIDQCREIGAEHFASAMPEYCGVISVRPSAHLRLDKVEAEEQKMDLSVLEDALTRARVQPIDAVMRDVERGVTQVPEVQAPSATQVIIDIRHPDERELKPLRLGDKVAPLAIPFYSLNNEFPRLDASQEYLLYCERGVMSQLHAAHLRDAGFNNVGVYRPAEAKNNNANIPEG
ncbi:tRNA 4-thiouridine(8) synthase ThiI [Saccharophagus sp. K07]|uniref:tRNA uracil 4-sulfurtransferase ThiI n=1 Tax=Saccharophagus sp. K07 TaxID=2283636 RepID=UPI001651CD0B|nr:tRNA uracil 4-sulfurtransferase ThiI [Saccharophagus sp. K07]MBC6905871.1 tRNA 4-thiouridine(8) synthase ThiI [Saccharophagus sp. K07]